MRNSEQPLPPRRTQFTLWQKLLAGVSIPIGLFFWVSILLGIFVAEPRNKANYKAGHAAYEKADCQTALPKLKLVVEAKKDAESGYGADAKREYDECTAYQAGMDQQKAGKPAAALLAYSNFAQSHNQSPLIKPAQTQVKDLVAKAKPNTLASPELCEKIDQLSQQTLVPEPAKNLPPLYLACGDQYATAKNYDRATQMYDTVLKTYKQHPVAKQANANLAKVLIDQAATTQAGEIPLPPNTGSSGSDLAAVKVQNSSPSGMRIAFTGTESRVEEIEPCKDCIKYTEENVPPSCPDQGISKTYNLKPGTYKILVLSNDGSRVTPYKGTWDLQSGGLYDNCFYIVTRKQ